MLPLTPATPCQVQVQVLSADVGHRQLVTSRNPSTGRMQSSYQTVWRSVTLGWSWERSYPPTDPMMQLYASYKYPIRQIQPLAPGPLMYAARQLTPDLLQSSDGEATRRVGPFQVSSPGRPRGLLCRLAPHVTTGRCAGIAMQLHRQA
jgi:hypothetical protein